MKSPAAGSCTDSVQHSIPLRLCLLTHKGSRPLSSKGASQPVEALDPGARLRQYLLLTNHCAGDVGRRCNQLHLPAALHDLVLRLNCADLPRNQALLLLVLLHNLL